jgi:outer membrane immunogenic protein
MHKASLRAGAAVAAILLSGSIAAHAADIVAPELEPEPAFHDWSGIYLGGHLGVGALGTEGRYNRYNNEGGSAEPTSSIDLGAVDGEIGPLWGGQIGFNWQAGHVVFGVEGDLSLPDWYNTAFEAAQLDSDTSTIGLEIDMLASVRARVGWADDNVLFYVTGGFAWYEGELTRFGGTDGDCNGANPLDNCSIDISAKGGVAGAGLEWAFTQNITARVEGLYYFFGDKTSLCGKDRNGNDKCDGNDEELIKEADFGDYFKLDDAIVARLGVNIRFNPF